MIEIKIKRNESIERALRRFKKKLDQEGLMQEVRDRRYFEKPGDKRRRKVAYSKRQFILSKSVKKQKRQE